ncbi:MAG: DNA-binding protein [Novosphingobium sp.]
MAVGAPSEWFSAAELADLALPGVPSTRQKVSELALCAGWHEQRASDGSPLARRRSGRGAGHEYHLSVLPLAARQALALRLEATGANSCPANDTFAGSAKMQAKARERLAIVRDVAALVAAGDTQRVAVASVSERWGVSERTIHRYLSAAASAPHAGEQLTALAPRHSGGGDTTVVVSWYDGQTQREQLYPLRSDRIASAPVEVENFRQRLRSVGRRAKAS